MKHWNASGQGKKHPFSEILFNSKSAMPIVLPVRLLHYLTYGVTGVS